MGFRMWKLAFCFFLLALATTALATAVSAITVTYNEDYLAQYTFEKYISDFGKRYADPEEHRKRNAIFNENLAKIRAFNGVLGRSYRLGINKFSDMTKEEFNAKFNGRVATPQSTRLSQSPPYKYTRTTFPEALNWQEAKNPVLTPVKDQGSCGSCWAHAATESVESMYAISTGKLLTLSTQQITSCVNNVRECGGSGGCGGGTAQLAWEYIENNGGITLDEEYPYVSGDTSVTGRCVLNRSMPRVVNVLGYVSIPHNNYEAAIEALVQKGPLAVSVDASGWMFYTGGVFDDCGKDGANITINHAVQLVGYGKDNKTNQDYWIVRNSWGEGWGEKGFIRLLRKKHNEPCVFNNDWNTAGGGCADDPNITIVACGMCGVLYDVAYPVVMKPPERGRFLWAAVTAFGGLCVVMIVLMILSRYCGSTPKVYEVFCEESEILN
ncbi:cysteine protease, putative [Trypanosoma cruzi marinkellei]|uniref:Cysteine protease, putative n=1 Tax=Trypanosoma cruzi marinkellei TaxID=85056 RepID=K2PDT6_TRYCR|nr:cysteine protease, putative [Trypanosoma cruzi marinkellei]